VATLYRAPCIAVSCLLCRVRCRYRGLQAMLHLCWTETSDKLLLRTNCFSWTSRHAAFYKKASRGKISLQERPLGKITVEDLHKPSVRYLYARSLYNKVSTRDLRARSLQEISKISVQALYRKSLSKISVRDLLAQSLREISTSGLCTRSLEEVFLQDLCTSSL